MQTQEREAIMSNTTLPGDLLPVKEAAQRSGANIYTLRSWIRTGKVSKYRQGAYRVLVSLTEVERMQRIELVSGGQD